MLALRPTSIIRFAEPTTFFTWTNENWSVQIGVAEGWIQIGIVRIFFIYICSNIVCKQSNRTYTKDLIRVLTLPLISLFAVITEFKRGVCISGQSVA